MRPDEARSLRAVSHSSALLHYSRSSLYAIGISAAVTMKIRTYLSTVLLSFLPPLPYVHAAVPVRRSFLISLAVVPNGDRTSGARKLPECNMDGGRRITGGLEVLKIRECGRRNRTCILLIDCEGFFHAAARKQQVQ